MIGYLYKIKTLQSDSKKYGCLNLGGNFLQKTHIILVSTGQDNVYNTMLMVSQHICWRVFCVPQQRDLCALALSGLTSHATSKYNTEKLNHTECDTSTSHNYDIVLDIRNYFSLTSRNVDTCWTTSRYLAVL